MIESNRLPKRIRRKLGEEVAASEVIQWIEQPIPRLFTPSTLVICLILLISLSVFLLVGFGTYEHSINAGIPVYEFPQVLGIFIPLFGAAMQLILLFLIPLLNWLEAIQSVYVITDGRAFILQVGASTTVTSFLSSELRVILRRQHRDGSGDVIVYIHRSKGYDGEIQTKEIGFKQVHNSKVFENMLRQINANSCDR